MRAGTSTASSLASAFTVVDCPGDAENPSDCTSVVDAEAVAERVDAVGYLECSAMEPETVIDLIQKSLLTSKEYNLQPK